MALSGHPTVARHFYFPLFRAQSEVCRAERIGWGLKERYKVSKELPSSLLALVRKLDAVEGKLLLRRMHQAPAVRGGWPDNLPLAEPAWL
jgi:hypothetical protein